ncbi:hypothetical protein [Massilia sp. CCM 8734]|uniref:hypothetical protein n=1 Tax=Massilia sp. CCM 8734 TaxID=2609283 RepID=UPI0014245037|nr:hypothetical protein [Massilia sp. CCM 8734]NHZ95915.1 hypothetical protein [Massilia sp. CCM 8734]
MPQLALADFPPAVALAAASPDCDWVANFSAVQQFALPLMPVFVQRGTALIAAGAGRGWVSAMRELFGETGLKACMRQFALHARSMVSETTNGTPVCSQMCTLRDTVDRLLLPHIGDPGADSLFQDSERIGMLASTAALAVTRQAPDGWSPALSCDHPDIIKKFLWPALDHPSGLAWLRPLCEQLAGGQLWLLADGEFAPQGGAGARACALHITAEWPQWCQRVRALLVEGVRRDWIDSAQAEAVIARHPLLEPWYLLATPESEAGLEALTANLRARLPQRLRELAASKAFSPEEVIDLCYDIHRRGAAVFRWQQPWCYLAGTDALVGVLTWVASRKRKLGVRTVNDWADLMRHLAFVDDAEPAQMAALAQQLGQFPPAALLEVLPWCGRAQALVLEALGMAQLEPLRCWLMRQVGQDPACVRVPVDEMGNYKKVAGAPLDEPAAIAALHGVDEAACAELMTVYVKAGMFKMAGAAR